MKKFLALLFCLTILLSFAACSSESSTDTDSESGSESQTDSESESTNDTNSENENESESTTDNESESAPDNDKITFEGLTVVDNAECKINITDIDSYNFWGYTLDVKLENKSSEKTYMFALESASVNGVQCNPIFASEIAAGKKANEKIIFLDNELKENGITKFTDIELTFRVYDSHNLLADDVFKKTVHVYPYGEENAENFERQPQDSDRVIVDNQYVTVIVTGYEHDNIWGYSANLFVINKTEDDIMVSVDQASVNGYMIDPFFATSVSPQKCAFDAISWFDSSLEENGIEKVEEIEFTLRIYRTNDWLGDDLFNQTVTLNP